MIHIFQFVFDIPSAVAPKMIHEELSKVWTLSSEWRYGGKRARISGLLVVFY
jgi:hypothetical protein